MVAPKKMTSESFKGLFSEKLAAALRASSIVPSPDRRRAEILRPGFNPKLFGSALRMQDGMGPLWRLLAQFENCRLSRPLHVQLAVAGNGRLDRGQRNLHPGIAPKNDLIRFQQGFAGNPSCAESCAALKFSSHPVWFLSVRRRIACRCSTCQRARRSPVFPARDGASFCAPVSARDSFLGGGPIPSS